MGKARQGLERPGLGSGEPSLGVQIHQQIEQRAAAVFVQMGGDLVQQQKRDGNFFRRPTAARWPAPRRSTEPFARPWSRGPRLDPSVRDARGGPPGEARRKRRRFRHRARATPCASFNRSSASRAVPPQGPVPPRRRSKAGRRETADRLGRVSVKGADKLQSGRRDRHAATGHGVFQGRQPSAIRATGGQQPRPLPHGGFVSRHPTRMGRVEGVDHAIEKLAPGRGSFQEKAVHLRNEPEHGQMIGEIGLRAPPFPIDFDEPLERRWPSGAVSTPVPISAGPSLPSMLAATPQGDSRFRAERSATQIARFRRPQAPAGRQQGNGLQKDWSSQPRCRQTAQPTARPSPGGPARRSEIR